jgi:hypothetical protein
MPRRSMPALKYAHDVPVLVERSSAFSSGVSASMTRSARRSGLSEGSD